MKNAATRRTGVPAHRAPSAGRTADDPHDAINHEFLALWIGLSRLREVLCVRERRRPAYVARARTRYVAPRRPRRTAA